MLWSKKKTGFYESLSCFLVGMTTAHSNLSKSVVDADILVFKISYLARWTAYRPQIFVELEYAPTHLLFALHHALLPP